MSRSVPPETSVNGLPRPELGVPIVSGLMSNTVRPGPPSNTMREIGGAPVLVMLQSPTDVSPGSKTDHPVPLAPPDPVSNADQATLWLVPLSKNAVTIIPVMLAPVVGLVEMPVVTLGVPGLALTTSES